MEEKLDKICKASEWKVGERYTFCNIPYCCEWFVVSGYEVIINKTYIIVHYYANIDDEGLFYNEDEVVAWEFPLTPLERELLT